MTGGSVPFQLVSNGPSFNMKPKKQVRITTVKLSGRPYQRDGKLFCRAPDTGREVNLSDFIFWKVSEVGRQISPCCKMDLTERTGRLTCERCGKLVNDEDAIYLPANLSRRNSQTKRIKRTES
jgi:hypothetical protein